jgi:hypothetical protein
MDEVQRRIEEQKLKRRYGISANKKGYTIEEMADIIAAQVILKGGKKLLEEKKASEERGV